MTAMDYGLVGFIGGLAFKAVWTFCVKRARRLAAAESAQLRASAARFARPL